MTILEKRRKSRIVGLLWRFLAALVLTGFALGVAVGLVITSGVTAPEWLRSRIEERINQNLSGMRVVIAGIRLAPFGPDLNPSLSITGAELRDADGRLRVALPSLTGTFSARALVDCRLRPIAIRMSGARLLLRRAPGGRFDISIGRRGETGAGLPEGARPASAPAGSMAPEDAGAGDAGAGDAGGRDRVTSPAATFAPGPPSDIPASVSGSLRDIIERLDQILAWPVLSRLDQIQSTDTVLFLDDRVSGRRWTFRDGAMEIRRREGGLEASVNFVLDNKRGAMAHAAFTWRRLKGQGNSEFSTRFSGVRTLDLADQVVAFDWLRVLDAPLSGAMTMDIGADGSLGRMHGVLDIGAGRVRQAASAPAVRFRGAKAYLSYDPEDQKFTFDQVVLDTDAAHIEAEGQAYLSDRVDRTVGGLIGQFRFRKLRLDPEGVFEKPLEFGSGALDMRLRVRPLSVDIGQLVLVDGDSRYVMRGRLSAGARGWTTALDLSIADVPVARLKEFWPLIYKPKTRAWMADNILGGHLNRVNAALRARPGEAPEISVGFDFHDLALRYLKRQPPIEQGKGFGSWNRNRLQLTLQEGVVNAPEGGQVNLAGSRFTIPDTRIKGAPAELELRSRATIRAMLSVLDLEPFRYLSKAGLGTDLAEGLASVEGRLGFPLVEKLDPRAVRLSIDGVLTRLRSDKLVKGKVLTSDRLDLTVDNSGMTIAGRARLGRLPVSGAWRQDLGPQGKGHSKVTGRIELSRAFLREFGIRLPADTVSGKGSGDFVIHLDKGKAPQFTLTSDLRGLALRLDAVGWRKAADVAGKLDVRGSFGTPPRIPFLHLTAPGLVAEGEVRLGRKGQLEVARFGRVDVGGWLKAPVEIRPGPGGTMTFNLDGGMLDLRHNRFGDIAARPGMGNAINVNLDRLVVSRGISLTGLSGQFNTSGGLTGSFTGAINGKARIIGTVAPLKGGTAVRFASTDAGAALRAAGVFSNAYGGRLEMLLKPADAPGQYRGSMSIRKTRVREASGLAQILSAISVVGLLEQLDGEGILFNDIEAEFLLGQTGVKLYRSSAVGASLGLTMRGVYDFASQSLDMRGVITPIYMLNGLLEQSKLFGKLFGGQKGEGLFGFNYTMRGPVDSPKVGVNPLSILTPGLFRDIFRQPIPGMKAPRQGDRNSGAPPGAGGTGPSR